MKQWIEELFKDPELLEMGHLQREEDSNLGFGWVYYGLARALRPRTVVVIGSYRGFVPLMFGKALGENLEGGTVYFIDPSYVDDFWKDAEQVNQYFAGFGVANVRHFLMTTQQFVESDAYRNLSDVGIVFVDGYHSEEQARFDYEAFEPRLATDGLVLFHDSAKVRPSKIYGEEQVYDHRVKCLIDEFKLNVDLQVFDIPIGDGITLVRKSTGPT